MSVDGQTTGWRVPSTLAAARLRLASLDEQDVERGTLVIRGAFHARYGPTITVKPVPAPLERAEPLIDLAAAATRSVHAVVDEILRLAIPSVDGGLTWLREGHARTPTGGRLAPMNVDSMKGRPASHYFFP